MKNLLNARTGTTAAIPVASRLPIACAISFCLIGLTLGIPAQALAFTSNLVDPSKVSMQGESVVPIEQVRSIGGLDRVIRHRGGQRRSFGNFKGSSGKLWKYDRRHHGYRYKGYDHHLSKYWHGLSHWLPGIGLSALFNGYNQYYHGESVAKRSAHMEWCKAKYRSYNIKTDSFRGYDGRDHRCISPYS